MIFDTLNTDFKILNQVGQGGYGRVFKTECGNVRKFSKHTEGDIFELHESFLKEVSYLTFLKKDCPHPNIIQIDDIKCNREYGSFLMPLASKTLKSEFIESIEERKKIIYQIIRGLVHLHSRHIMHLDIKPENILLFSDGSVKICDFGISLLNINGTEDKFHDVISIFWKPIELLFQGIKNYNFNVDVWSVSVILLSLASKVKYYEPKLTNRELLANIIKLIGLPSLDDLNLEYGNNPDKVNSYNFSLYGIKDKNSTTSIKEKFGIVDKDELDFLEKTLTFPRKRLSSIEALRHKYFDSVRDEIEGKFPLSYDIKNMPKFSFENVFRKFDNVVKLENINTLEGNTLISERLMYTFNNIISHYLYQNKRKISSKIIITSFLYVYKYIEFCNKILEKNEINNIGVVALLLSSNMYELSPFPPEELASFTNLSGEQFFELEFKLFKILNYDLVVPISLNYIFNNNKNSVELIKYFSKNDNLALSLRYILFILTSQLDICSKYTQEQLASFVLNFIEDEGMKRDNLLTKFKEKSPFDMKEKLKEIYEICEEKDYRNFLYYLKKLKKWNYF
jgi:serine/threonine protein kinase